MVSQECGLIQSTCTTEPFNVTGLLASNSAENAWCAATGAPASKPPIKERATADVHRMGSVSSTGARGCPSTRSGHPGGVKRHTAQRLLLLLIVLLIRIDIYTGRHEDAVAVPFMTRVLENLMVRFPPNEGVQRDRERARERLGSSILASYRMTCSLIGVKRSTTCRSGL